MDSLQSDFESEPSIRKARFDKADCPECFESLVSGNRVSFCRGFPTAGRRATKRVASQAMYYLAGERLLSGIAAIAAVGAFVFSTIFKKG